MVASEVEICNRALQRLGAKNIVSLSDDSVNARACNVAYAPLRDAELRKQPWNFAIARAVLAASATPPAFGPTNAFPLPADFLRLLPPDRLQNFTDLDWTVEDGAVLTYDQAPLHVRYIYQVTDPNAMDPLFREALSCSMAFELCEALTQSNAKKEGLRNDYKDIIGQAKRANGIEKVPVDPPDDVFTTARL